MSAAVRGLTAGAQIGADISRAYLVGLAASETIAERKQKEARAAKVGELIDRVKGEPAGTVGATPPVPVTADLTVGLGAPPVAPVSAALPTTSAWTPGSPMQTRAEMEAAARYHAQRAGLDPDLVVRQVQAESGFDPNAVSPAGAFGLLQLMPATAAQPGYGVAPARDKSPEENLRVGTDYLAAMIREYGDVGLALAAYNAGPGRVKKGGTIPNIPETQAYVAKVRGGSAPDTRMADISDQSVPAVGFEGLPARPPAPSVAIADQSWMLPGLRGKSASEIAKMYQDVQMSAMADPELAKELAPLAEQIKVNGKLAHMSQFQGDPMTREGAHALAVHMAQADMMFGDVPDARELFTMAYQDDSLGLRDREEATRELARQRAQFEHEIEVGKHIASLLDADQDDAAKIAAKKYLGVDVVNIKDTTRPHPITGRPIKTVTFEYIGPDGQRQVNDSFTLLRDAVGTEMSLKAMKAAREADPNTLSDAAAGRVSDALTEDAILAKQEELFAREHQREYNPDRRQDKTDIAAYRQEAIDKLIEERRALEIRARYGDPQGLGEASLFESAADRSAAFLRGADPNEETTR